MNVSREEEVRLASYERDHQFELVALEQQILNMPRAPGEPPPAFPPWLDELRLSRPREESIRQ